MKSWQDVGAFSDLEREGVLIAKVRGREIGVVLVGTEPRALRNRCPHSGAPLCRGRVVERLTGPPGSYALEGRRTLSCPWHGWQFDLETGESPDEPKMRVAVYAVEVRDGRVLVEA